MFLPSVFLLPVQNDYNVLVSQDNSGYYRIIYYTQNVTKIEERHQDGSLHGTYTYIDTHGNPQTISYIASNHGLRVISSTSPQQSNNRAVKQKHWEEVRRAIDELERRLSGIRPLVPFTSEVVKVTIEHLKAVEIAKIAAKQGGFADCAIPELLTDSRGVKVAKALQVA